MTASRLIDFSPVVGNTAHMYAFSHQFTIADLRAGTHASIDLFLQVLEPVDDAAIAFIPDDPKADDPGAPPEERYLGWSLGHLIAHTTASAEEYATVSSVLARGVPYGREPRLRYETPWRMLTTKAQAVQRLEESRRMRVALLDVWPDAPNLTLLREISDRYRALFGEQDARAAFLIGLYHDAIHYDQFRDAAAQAMRR
jgi:hypothetical protein